MTLREQTKPIKVGNIIIGGSNKIVIQSMCDIKTSKVDEVVNEILECEKVGLELIRVSVLDYKDALAIKEIKKRIHVPLVADIHIDHKLGIAAIENGADKIRINPGNIGDDKKLYELLDVAKNYNVPIRIGVNLGSISNSVRNLKISDSEKLVLSALDYVKKFEDYRFFDIVISVKASDALTTIEAYKKLSEKTKYPLHLGVTESGFDEIGIIRSVSALSPLLIEGIGSTIRISLTQNPKKEVLTCVRLLKDLGLYENYPNLISCPTCGRTQVKNLREIASKILTYLEEHKKYITVAVMGCVINGVGEGKSADIGIAGGNGKFVIFKKGKIIETVNENEVLNKLFRLIDEY